MGQFLIVSRAEQLNEYKQLSAIYHVGFEINDFYDPAILEDSERLEVLIDQYLQAGIPKGSTMHGAFLDVAVFSQDDQIRQVSEFRMNQSMEIASRLGVKGVVFHTNYNPFLAGTDYDNCVVNATVSYVRFLLETYPNIDIYLENMFDRTPEILLRISQQLAGYSNYGVCFDYAHASIYGEALPIWVDALAGYIKHIHINDNDLIHDLHLAIGDGQLDWKQFETYYRQYFNSCSVLIETTPIANQKRSFAYMNENTRIWEPPFDKANTDGGMQC